jgi:hypothetical protein
MPYSDVMAEISHEVLAKLKKAYENGVKWVLFIHGSSTSGPGKTTARSMVRGVMRYKDATPYICRSKCIQHETVFLAAIRPKKPSDTRT